MYKNIQTNNTSLTKSPTKKEKSQLNHFFCSLYGFIKLEVMSLESKRSEVKKLLKNGNSIKAISYLQAKYKLGLKVSKDIVDKIKKMPNV